MTINEITEAIIGASIEVHRELGPGLLESAYIIGSACATNLNLRGVPFVPVVADGLSKKAEVPAIEIDRAFERKNKYEANPRVHGVKR